ncbi:MAG: MmgE/PrpD family protein, partial [Candidatus Lambdaproteobacteria bacterium]|nr:MmgE/PrpD family protein [Candidatus Lambdaproteobacteria bacterium]
NPMQQATPIGDAAARFIAATAGRKHAPEVIDAAKMCLVDWMGVALGAVNEPPAVAVRRTAESWGTQGKAHILLGPAVAPAAAALVNGTMAHCMDYDDTHTEGGGHISGPTWAAALAMAEELGKSGGEALAAFITGFEVSARLGAGGVGRKLQFIGFHPSSIFGRFAAAAVTCALLGLDAERTAHALGVAATTAGGLNASFGTMSKPFHPGKAALDGILAGQLAAAGFEAATHLLDAENGLSGALIQDRSVKIAPKEFSEGFALLKNSFKPYACCKATHACVDSARQLSAQVKGQAIRKIIVGGSAMTERVASKPNPQTPLEGKFSVAYCVALALRGHPAVEHDFSEQRLRDPAIRELIAKAELAVQPDMDLNTGFVEVQLGDGRTLRADTPLALGNPGNPMSWSAMETKFSGLVEPVLGRDTKTLFEALRRVDESGQLGRITALVAPRRNS